MPPMEPPHAGGICARNLCRLGVEEVGAEFLQPRSSSSALSLLCRASTCECRACTSKFTACLAEEAWLLRYLFVSRAVWQGYNVLLLDTDSWLYRDPYLYLTRPPFHNIRWAGSWDRFEGVGGIELNWCETKASVCVPLRLAGPAFHSISTSLVRRPGAA